MSVIAVIGLLTTVIAGDALTKKETDNQSSVLQNSTRKPESSTDEETITPCPEPRPRLCTMDYRPVCAKLNDGSVKTYSNGCSACTDPVVTGYRDGACE